MIANWNVSAKDDRLIRVWSAFEHGAKYDPEWLTSAQPGEVRVLSSVLDMNRLSLFGAADWYGYDLVPNMQDSPTPGE